MHLMGNPTCSYFIWSWPQHVVARPCIDPSFKTMQPHLHDVRNWTLQTLRVQNSINVISARSKITDVASMVMEEWQRPSSWHWPNAVSALRQKCVAEAVCLDAQLHEPRHNIKVWPCHQERSPVFTASWRTGTKDTRCCIACECGQVCIWHIGSVCWHWVEGPPLVCAGTCISEILTNCQWLNTDSSDNHIQLQNTEIFITKSICVSQVIRPVIEMNLLPNNMNGEVGLVMSNLWNSLIHPQRDCRCPLLRCLICSLSFFRNNIMLLSLSTSSTPPPTKVLVAVLLCSQFQLYLPFMSYLTSSDSSSRPQGPVLV